jgi:PEP-CTERM motif
VFGVGSSGLIVGNAANSGAEGITGGDVPTIPEPSTWAMMLLGFAGLGYAGFRKARSAISIC